MVKVLQLCELLEWIEKSGCKAEVLAESDPTVDWHSIAPDYTAAYGTMDDDLELFLNTAKHDLAFVVSRRDFPGRCPACPE